jgi:hypothetical protein
MNKAKKILLTVVGLISAPFIANWAYEEWIFASPERVYANFRPKVAEARYFTPSMSFQSLCSTQRYLYYIAHNLHKSANTRSEVDKLINLRWGGVIDHKMRSNLKLYEDRENTELYKLEEVQGHSNYGYETGDCDGDYRHYLHLIIIFDKQEKLIATGLKGIDPKTGKFMKYQIIWRSGNV